MSFFIILGPIRSFSAKCGPIHSCNDVIPNVFYVTASAQEEICGITRNMRVDDFA